MIRLIASDLDGTLLTKEGDIHPENLAAIREAGKRGVHFAMVSGRSVASCTLLLEDAGLMDASIIALNGCQIVDKPCGKTLAIHYLPHDAARITMDTFARFGLEACLYTADTMVYTSEKQFQASYGTEKAEHVQRMAEAGMRIAGGEAAVQAALLTTPMKAYCVYHPGQEEAFAEAKAICEGIPGVELTTSWWNNFEVMPKGVDKGVALKALTQHLGIRQEEVLAFGDNGNDLPMLQWAGYGCAVANARPEVLAAVTHHTGHCEEAGVARAIERFVLG